MIRYPKLLTSVLVSLLKSKGRLEAEVVLLRHQLNVLRRAAPPRVMSLANPLWGARASMANCSSSAPRSARPLLPNTWSRAARREPNRRPSHRGLGLIDRTIKVERQESSIELQRDGSPRGQDTARLPAQRRHD